MAKPKISIYIRLRTADGKQPYCPAIWENKKLKSGWCTVKGVPEFHPEANYHLRYIVNGVSKWEAVEGDADHVLDLVATRREQLSHPRAHKEFISNITSKGKTEADTAPARAERYRLDDEIKTYLTNIEKLSGKTYKAYRLSLTMFLQMWDKNKTYLDQIAKQDLQAFDSFLLKQGHEDRTRANRIQHVITFLRNKEGRREGSPVTDVSIRIKYVEQPPEAYSRQELEGLFRVSSEDDRLLWRFFLGTGFREAEASVAEYEDINLENKTISVVEKPYFDFKPKDCEKRIVPIPDELIARLAARKNGYSLIFGKREKPDGHLIRRLKSVAYKGGLNCAKCQRSQHGKPVSCADASVCERWILHRFRKNFATDRHQAGGSARQIQKWLGHSSLETTLRYLATMDDTSEQVREICNIAHAGL